MCGLVGYFSASDGHGGEHVLSAMADAIAVRGPDDRGYWLDREAGIALGHLRLAIVDLSPAGHQPMVSASGRYVIAWNGEIYNHTDLREELCLRGAAPPWRGHSDTESLLAAFDAWGVERTIVKCIGMFAFAVWDREQKTLTLGRDRLGEKPLYYGWQTQRGTSAFLFASELSAIKAHPAFSPAVDTGALTLFMRHGYVPTPHSIYRGISKLKPGCLLTFRTGGGGPTIETYWSAKHAVETGLHSPFQGSPAEAVDALAALLKDAVGRQMVADVPLGAFLSGGIDSSTIVALMQEVARETHAPPVKTFTIGFGERSYNEAEHAKAVAAHLGTEHTELYVSAEDALAVVPKLPSIYSEPFADSSQIPTFLVSQMARHKVTVSLSGDGGDELFGGYNRYVLGQRLWSKFRVLPVGLRRTIGGAITRTTPEKWNQRLSKFDRFVPRSLVQARLGEKLHKGAGALAANTTDELYRTLVSQWHVPTSVVKGATEPLTSLTDVTERAHTDHFVHQMMAADLASYLPDDILCKVDRAAMGVSLETRVPLLDHRVVEFAWSLPLSYKLRDGVGKWPLRQLLYRHVPRELIDRPKMGFGIPIDAWLRGPLRHWAEDLLDASRLRREGYLESGLIRELWSEHLVGRCNWAYRLWPVLMFQAWLDTNV